jgi:alkylhydroperoxidase family enzyme
MARIRLVDADEPGLDSELAQRLRDAPGEVLNVIRTLANHPAAARAVGELSGFSYGLDSSLAPTERELAYLTASLTNSCHY